MYLLYNMGRYSVRVNDQTKLLEIEKSKNPTDYPQAAKLAAQSAKADSDNFRRRSTFRRKGTAIGEHPDNRHLYDFSSEGNSTETP